MIRRPPLPFSPADRDLLKNLCLVKASFLPRGTVLWCSGGRTIAQSSVEHIPLVAAMAQDSIDTLVLSPSDYYLIQLWITHDATQAHSAD